MLDAILLSYLTYKVISLTDVLFLSKRVHCPSALLFYDNIFVLDFQGGSVLNQIVNGRLISEVFLGLPFLVSVSKFIVTFLFNLN